MEEQKLRRRYVDAHYRAYMEKQKKMQPNRETWHYFMVVEENPSTYITPTIPKGKSFTRR